MHGELDSVSVAGMLRLMMMYGQTGILRISSQNGKGEVYLDQGKVVGTGAGHKRLYDEVLRLVMLRNGGVAFEPLSRISEDHQQGMIEHIENLILEASRQMGHAQLQDLLPPEEAVLQLAPLSAKRKTLRLNLDNAEWNFVMHVDGEESLGSVLKKCGLPMERALQAAYGLLAAGLARKTRFLVPSLIEIANQQLGNMGEALVRQAFRKLEIDPNRMRMKHFINILNELERNITLLLGPTKASAIIAIMWEKAKH